ncbi:MAG: YlmC/YmxH family sporulation protein [Clostridia bacterium]|nr:YlmC/YmxH family sporulation protein [Clostridia bacterium]
METTFCELKGKEVINVLDGKRLGRIIDIVFETKCGKILGLVVPNYCKSWNIFKQADDIFIPFSNVCKIGDDVILVEIFVQNKTKILEQKNSDYVRTANVQETTINTPCPNHENNLGGET